MSLKGGTGPDSRGGRGRSHKFKGRKLRQSRPFWNSGQAAESVGLSTTTRGVGPSPAPPAAAPPRSLPGLSSLTGRVGTIPYFINSESQGSPSHFNISDWDEWYSGGT